MRSSSFSGSACREDPTNPADWAAAVSMLVASLSLVSRVSSLRGLRLRPGIAASFLSTTVASPRQVDGCRNTVAALSRLPPARPRPLHLSSAASLDLSKASSPLEKTNNHDSYEFLPDKRPQRSTLESENTALKSHRCCGSIE